MTAVRAGTSVAIVGIGCRFPGHANSPEEFWSLLCGGVDAIRDIPDDRFDLQRFYDPDPSKPGRSYVRRAGIADHSGPFDASFFGISRREAVQMDPQQRLLLEVVWEAFEDAGLPVERIAGNTDRCVRWDREPRFCKHAGAGGESQSHRFPQPHRDGKQHRRQPAVVSVRSARAEHGHRYRLLFLAHRCTSGLPQPRGGRM